ncbi:MAG: beta-N-acetylhexosaminidase [Candidatus Lokiarchaeota archaeon]|nr:beta-N-acetylhexosaminidase [Candidatus Lokiarchaeota archaeon]
MNAIFPLPVKITEIAGSLAVPEKVLDALAGPSAGFQAYADRLARLDVQLHTSPINTPIAGIGTEGYTLRVSNDGIAIGANSEAGCFYGAQTLRWMLQPDGSGETCTCQAGFCEIMDYPRFPYRGYMLDEGRYFLGVDVVKSVLDWMALLKLNRFHWHLTEDQGWRAEIKKYPRLTEIGSKRDSTPRYRNREPPNGETNSDGTPHCGFYTQEQVKDVVAFAGRRHITIVPEIEMPGHATAALASYPEMRCVLPDDLPPGGADVLGRHLDGSNIKVATRWGVSANILCAGNPKTIDFLHDILKEVVDLFPGPVIHIGGDEVPKTQWICCERCQERIANLGLKSEEELQKAFTAEIIDYLASLGKQTMLWNEHTDEGLAARKDNVICQYWTGSLDKVAGFLEKGGRLVMSPSSHVYVDHSYALLPLRKVYHYEPLGEEAEKALSKRAFESASSGGIIGVEAPMWGEVFKSKWQVEYCTFPRLLAVADIAWAPKGAKDHAGFMKRVERALEYLDVLKINHATLEDADPSDATIERAKKHPDFGGYAYF